MSGNDTAAIIPNLADPDMLRFLHKGVLYSSDDDEELQNALKEMFEVDTILVYSSKKLANLENLLRHVLAGENCIEAINFESDNISVEFIEKALTFDILYAVLNFELRELDKLLSNRQDIINDTLQKISSSERSTELLTNFGCKLHDSENLLRQSHDRVLEMTIQLAKLQMTSFVFKHTEYKHNLDVAAVKHELHLARTEWNHEFLTGDRRRILRMLGLSLASEVELEKILTRLKQNEEDLKVKIRLTELVGVGMEEAAEVAWGRFLEADNAAAVLMEISKETAGRLQNLQTELINSKNREGELKSVLQGCINQLNEKEILIQRLNTDIAQLTSENAKVTSLREQVQMLEKHLGETESQANASHEKSREQIKSMEVEIESLRKNVYAAESRVENAEEKVTHLTETNVELTEELDFVKCSNETTTKKMSILEKQLREFDIQLQHARASSENGQEQQNMLYTAIWDMETLIDELKQKVASYEVKLESTEEQCVLLSASNKELNKEVEFLRSKMKFMGDSLNEAMVQKQSSAEDVSVRTRLIMDMVVQIATERERIQKQLASVTKDNKFLRERLQKEQSNAFINAQNGINVNDEEFALLEPANTFVVKATDEVSTENFQVDGSAVNESRTSSNSENPSTNSIPEPKADDRLVEKGKSQRRYTFMASLVLLVSLLAAQLLIIVIHVGS